MVRKHLNVILLYAQECHFRFNLEGAIHLLDILNPGFLLVFLTYFQMNVFNVIIYVHAILKILVDTSVFINQIVEKTIFLNNFLLFNLHYGIKTFQNTCNIHFTA